jgi:hypothetical protein
VTLRTPTAFDFDVQCSPSVLRAQVLAGDRYMIEESEWLQMTIGPWLVPARRGSARGTVEYLLQGPEPEPTDDTSALIKRETAALESAFRRVDRSLFQLDEAMNSDPDIPLSTSLLSIRLLLGVCLPRADNADALHLRAERLQFTQWGLEGGISLSLVLAELQTGRSRYLDSLSDTLHRKYAVVANVRSEASQAMSTLEMEPADLRFWHRIRKAPAHPRQATSHPPLFKPPISRNHKRINLAVSVLMVVAIAVLAFMIGRELAWSWW